MVRWRRPAATPATILDGAVFVVICGVIGARLYHVITDYQRFDHGHWVDAFEDLEGRPLDLGRGDRRRDRGHRVPRHGASSRRSRSPTACRSGIVLAQAIGRWGNWFNQELFGKPTTLPWGARDRAGAPARRRTRRTRRSTRRSSTSRSTACLGIAGSCCWSTSARLRRGQTYALYVDHLHVWPLLLREPAHRRRAPDRRAARERVGLRDRLRGRRRVVRVVRPPRRAEGTPSR